MGKEIGVAIGGARPVDDFVREVGKVLQPTLNTRVVLAHSDAGEGLVVIVDLSRSVSTRGSREDAKTPQGPENPAGFQIQGSPVALGGNGSAM